MTVAIDLSVILWVGGVFVTIVGGAISLLFKWLSDLSKQVRQLGIDVNSCITEERCEKVVKDMLDPVKKTVDENKRDFNSQIEKYRTDVARLTQEINTTVNIVRNNMQDLLLKLVGK